MMEPALIADNDFVLRHIPSGPSFQAPPSMRITSLNFRLRPQDHGISVSVASLTSPESLMQRLGSPGSRIAVANVGELRELGLEVVPVPEDEYTGHAEIRAVSADLTQREILKKLTQIFRYIDEAS